MTKQEYKQILWEKESEKYLAFRISDIFYLPFRLIRTFIYNVLYGLLYKKLLHGKKVWCPYISDRETDKWWGRRY